MSYWQGIDIRPPSGLHMLLSNRSGALLTLGDKLGALADANAAAMLAPPGFHTAYVRQVTPIFLRIPSPVSSIKAYWDFPIATCVSCTVWDSC